MNKTNNNHNAMKRIITFIACIFMMSSAAFAVSSAKCLLQHKGSCKLYDPDAISTAIKNAVNGDTIFLTEGTFPGFTIDKKITVRGAGQGTIVKDHIKISIAGSPTLEQTVLEGINTQENVYLTTSMNGVKIKQCSITALWTQANNNDVIIERCHITSEVVYSNYIKGMTILNSIVGIGISNSSYDPVLNLVNCYVTAYYVNNVAGTFINCIVDGYSYSNYNNECYYNCNFVNSLLCGNYRNTDSSTCTVQNCYENEDQTSFDANTLENLGYLGNDGTIVGEYGGNNPYTLELAVPKVTESKISLDMAKKTLNVNLKVSAN